MMQINRRLTVFVFVVLLFSPVSYKQALGQERDEIKQQMQELRQQMEAMQKKLEELEEKNRMLEEGAQRQKEEQEIEQAVIEASPPARRGGLQGIIQSLNPDISLIGIFSAAYFSEDDPIVHAEIDPENTGINLQEAELGVQAVVDPYFRFDSFFALRREVFEIEESYITTILSLPLNSQIRAGIMRSKFGRINLQHREFQDFVTLPLPAAAFLGEHLNPTGVEFNFLLPLPWFAELSASVNSPELETATFARDEDGNNLGRLLYIAHLSNFFELSDDLSLSLGGSFATASNGTEEGNRSNLYGADLFFKYRPLRDNPYQEFWFQSEFFYRQAEAVIGEEEEAADADLDDWGAYGQFVYRFAKRWNTGFRFDFTDTDDELAAPEEGEEGEEEEEGVLGLFGQELRYAMMLTFNPTEFSRIRLQYEFDDPDFSDSFHAVFLQLQYSIGPHGAHPF